MKIAIVLFLGILLSGCAGGVKAKDLDRLREQLEAKMDSSITQIRSDFNTMREDYLKMRELTSEVTTQLEKLIKMEASLEKLDGVLNARVIQAEAKVLRTLGLDEKLLGLRLAEVRQMIEDLKKPVGGNSSNP